MTKHRSPPLGAAWITRSPLPLIPVLDLKGGRVVRGDGRDRADYRPWLSPLCPVAEPAQFAAAVRPLVGHDRLYVADIDALQGGPPDYRRLAELAVGRRLWCDVGIRNRDAARRLSQVLNAGAGAGIVVLASESVPNLATFESILATEAPEQFAISFDWRGERLLSPRNWLNGENWLDVACRLAELGLRRYLLVDLDAVGSGRGARRWRECQQLRRHVADAEIVAGGGVVEAANVATLQSAGCDAVLAASALHQVAAKVNK